MIGLSKLNESFWGYALLTTAFTLNRVPSKAVEKTPYEIWVGRRPNMSFLRVWGCDAYVKRMLSTKLEPKSERCVFVGYPKETKGYYFYNPSEDKAFVARTGVFLEKDYISTTISGRNVDLGVVQEPQDTSLPTLEQEPIPQGVVKEPSIQVAQNLHRSNRTRQQPERYGLLLTQEGYSWIMMSLLPTRRPLLAQSLRSGLEP